MRIQEFAPARRESPPLAIATRVVDLMIVGRANRLVLILALRTQAIPTSILALHAIRLRRAIRTLLVAGAATGAGCRRESAAHSGQARRCRVRSACGRTIRKWKS